MQRKGSYVYSDKENEAADNDNISEEYKVDEKIQNQKMCCNFI